MEEPGNFEARELLEKHGARVVPQPVDEHGMVADAALGDADVAYVTPSHQIPTAVAMPLERRQALMDLAHSNDLMIIEDDYECETSYMDHPLPALRSMGCTTILR